LAAEGEHAGEAVDEGGFLVEDGGYTGGLQSSGVVVAFVSEGVKAGGDHIRGSDAVKWAEDR
jgi:hypothetical protein